MTEVSDALNRLYQEKSQFIVLGLTGKTGSGCSRAAQLLKSTSPNFPESSKIYDSNNDKRKYRIIHKFITNNWKPFTVIQVRAVITSIILELDFDSFIDFVSQTLEKEVDDIKTNFKSFQESFDKMHQLITSYKTLPEGSEDERNKKKEEAWNVYFGELPDFCEEFKTALQNNLGVDSYPLLYQKAGDNIRSSGTAHISKFNADKIFMLSQKINKLI